MCGICGWISLRPYGRPEHMSGMLEALKERGPDDCGTWFCDSQTVALGHTRLCIIDPDGSAQPMTNETGSIVVTYNGEIYNHLELRRALAARGHVLRTAGDTEVIVHLYEEYGDRFVEHLDGMFAIGLYDSQRRRLLLARDRIGIKPLYYWYESRGGELVFASDLRAVMAKPDVPRRLNTRALAQYLHFGYVVHPQSWLQNVWQVEPGQIVSWQDGRLEQERYYEWQYRPREELGRNGASVEELEQTLRASVASHLVADVPVGSFLSGGLDSATVTGMAQGIRRESSDAIDSFTVQFWLPDYDESERARRIAAELQTRHTEIAAERLAFDRQAIDALIDGLGEPFGDTSALAVYLLCQQARRHVKCALSGDGGDELFLGYVGLQRQRLARRLRILPTTARRALAEMLGGARADHPRRLRKYLDLSLLSDPELIVEWARSWEEQSLRSLLADGLFEQLFPDSDQLFPEVNELIGSGERGGFAEQQMRFHMLVDLPCDCLFKVDRMSMAHGLEVRVPMIADRMLDYGAALPLALRARGSRTKEPLRTVAEEVAPTVAEPSRKRGFAFPFDAWMRDKLGLYWREWELTEALASVGLSPKEVDTLVGAYEGSLAGRESYETSSQAARLFNLMLLGVWVAKYEVRM